MTSRHPGANPVRQILVVLLLTFFTGSLALGDQAGEDYRFAQGLFRSRRFEQAKASFKKFLDDYPDHPGRPVARLYYGLTLSNLEEYSAAREEFTKFVDKNATNKNYPDAIYRIGECSYYLKEYALAERQLRSYRDKYPKHSLVNWAYLFEADSQLAQAKWQDAETTFNTLLRRNPEEQTRRDAQYGLARCKEGLKDLDGALSMYGALVTADDPIVSPRALSRAGNIRFAREEYTQASTAYSRIDKLYPGHPLARTARLNVGTAMYRQRRYKEAIPWLVKAAKSPRHEARARLLHAHCLQRLGKFEEATTLLDGALARPGIDKAMEPEIRFYRADGKRLANKPAEAVGEFVSLVDKYPKSEWADDALFLAADTEMKNNRPTEAAALLDRLRREYSTNDFVDKSHLLRGRVLISGGTPKELDDGVAEFDLAIKKAKEPRTKYLSVYYLTKTLQRKKDYKQALLAAQPLLGELRNGNQTDLAEVLVHCSHCSIAVEQWDNAARYAGSYLIMQPKGTRRTEAYEARAISKTRLGDQLAADKDLESLVNTEESVNRQDLAIRRVGDVAWDLGKFEWSASLFEKIVAHRESPERPTALSALGWDYYKLDRFDNAAKAFKQHFIDYPNNGQAPQSRMMYAKSLRDGKKLDDAAAAYSDVFERYRPKGIAEAGGELPKPASYSFDAGKAAADLYEELNQTAVADRVYKQLFETFPKGNDMDKIVRNWAFMHADNENYKRADVIFQKLVDNYPTSEYVPIARLSLAETDFAEGRVEAAEAVMKDLNVDARTGKDVREGALFYLIQINEERKDLIATRKYAAEYANAFPKGRYLNRISLTRGELLLADGKLEECKTVMKTLRDSIKAPNTKPLEWHGRVWIVLAQCELDSKNYRECRSIVDELLARRNDSDWYYQGYDIKGRSYKQQAPPDFDASRQWLRKVVIDEKGRGTATAARAQFLIGDTYMLNKNPRDAHNEYLKSYINYKGHREWQSLGLLQAAKCDVSLQRYSAAVKNYEDLINEFPGTKAAIEAQQELPKVKQAARGTP